MRIVNLKDYFYWYTTDEFVEVSEEVAAELRSQKAGERVHWQRMKRNKSNYSLDAEDGIENAACEFEPSPEKLVLREEQIEYLCRALNSLTEKQGTRLEAHILLGKTMTAIAQAEGANIRSVSASIHSGLRKMRAYLRKHYP